MTLIAAWKEGDTPVLIGDLVMSRIGEFESPHHPLPTRDDLDDLLPVEWFRHIVEPCQKVYAISDNVAIGWCDHKLSAKIIIKDIVNNYGGKTLSLSEIKNHFTSITKFKDLPCIIIGWVAENNKMTCFKWRSDQPQEFIVADAFVEGSGSEYFRSIFTPLAVLGENPIESVLTKVAHVLKDEVLYGTNLWQLFGGGFKIIYHDGQRFVVLPSVTYIFLQLEELEDEDSLVLIGPKRILKFHQENQVIQIMAVTLDETVISMHNRESQKLAPFQMHYTAPITAETGDKFEVRDNLSLSSSYYCICMDIKCIDRPSTIRDDQFILLSLVRCFPDNKKDSLLEIAEQPDNTERLVIQDKVFRDIFNYLKTVKRNRAATNA
jgi:hypothetical protein